MPSPSDGSGNGPIGLAQEHARSGGADVRVQGQLVDLSHIHPWPSSPLCWRGLADCELCGVTMLKLIINSSAWVVRRVEHVAFLDECTVRRRVSIDYEAPQDAAVFRRPDGREMRILPFAIMRRKNLVNFDFRDHDECAIPLLGLRQNQALTLAIIRAWAAATLQALDPPGTISPETSEFLDDVVAGDQIELWRAFKRMWDAEAGSQLRRLGKDVRFRVVLDRLADSFVLFGLHEGQFCERRIIKYSYDEPLTLRYTKPSYLRHGPDGRGGRERSEEVRLSRWGLTAFSAAMGFSPTRIKFPVPAAELAGSFHFKISAPPEVSIPKSVLLAGRPKPESAQTPAASATCTASQGNQYALMKDRERRRPSFDAISGGYPTVDLHVADVPYGSRSRALVEVEASATGWFATAAFSSCLASGILGFAAFAKPPLGVGSTLLMTFAAGLAVLLVRQDPHRLVTRLLSKVRLLATFTAVLALAAAVIMAASSTRNGYTWLLVLFIVSLFPTALVTASWSIALARSAWAKPTESPWEHHRPRKSRRGSDDPDLAAQLENNDRHETLAQTMEKETYPYDWAYNKLGFSRSAIRVASSEGDRLGSSEGEGQSYPWDKAFAAKFDDRLNSYLQAIETSNHNQVSLLVAQTNTKYSRQAPTCTKCTLAAEDWNDLTHIGGSGRQPTDIHIVTALRSSSSVWHLTAAAQTRLPTRTADIECLGPYGPSQCDGSRFRLETARADEVRLRGVRTIPSRGRALRSGGLAGLPWWR